MPSSSDQRRPNQEAAATTTPYDGRGRCTAHPQIVMRKRRALSLSWTTVRLRCPLCVMGADAARTSSGASEGASKKIRKSKARVPADVAVPKTPPPGDARSECCSASSTSPTIGTSGHSLPSDCSSPRSSAAFVTPPHGASCPAPLPVGELAPEGVACGMPWLYRTASGGGASYPGFYTGEIRNGQPHGMGTWRGCHNSSIMVEGRWVRGVHTETNPEGRPLSLCNNLGLPREEKGRLEDGRYARSNSQPTRPTHQVRPSSPPSLVRRASMPSLRRRASLGDSLPSLLEGEDYGDDGGDGIDESVGDDTEVHSFHGSCPPRNWEDYVVTGEDPPPSEEGAAADEQMWRSKSYPLITDERHAREMQEIISVLRSA